MTIALLQCGSTTKFDAGSNYDYEYTSPVWSNPETGYSVYIDDWAGLLEPSEEEELLVNLKQVTQYGHAAFVSISENYYYDTERYAREYYLSHFSKDSGTVFLIDMDERYIWIHSDGNIYRTITKSYANTITDNVYSYASDKEYFDCANTAFDQILTLLRGQKIAQPMKYISNALLAVTLALLINYFVVMSFSRSRKASSGQLMKGIYNKVEILDPSVTFTHQSRHYSPRSSGSSGGGGGGGGGGSSSGGGGGHSF